MIYPADCTPLNMFPSSAGLPLGGHSGTKNLDGGSEPQGLHRKTTTSFSKYDFVKIKVWLKNHYYILSRFLLARMLQSTCMPADAANRISLDVKKVLVEAGMLEIVQSDLDGAIYASMIRNGYSCLHMDRLRMIVTYHHERIPLVVVVTGSLCVGKTETALYLSQALHITSVLQTDHLQTLILPNNSILRRTAPLMPNGEEVVKTYRGHCADLQKSIEPILNKVVDEGKSMIVEGLLLDPVIWQDWVKKQSSSAVIVFKVLHIENDEDYRTSLLSWARMQPRSELFPVAPTIAEQVERYHETFSYIQSYLRKVTNPDSLSAANSLHVHEAILTCMAEKLRERNL